MKYKVGDKVLIKNDLKEMNFLERKHLFDGANFGVNNKMEQLAGKVAVITYCHSGHYHINLDGSMWSWDDSMFESEFTFANLKPCYIVKHRNGELRMVIDTELGLTIISKTGFHSEQKDYDGFAYRMDKAYDVVKVYGLSKYCYKSLEFATEDRDLIWEEKKEPEVIELTLQQIADKCGVFVEQLRIKE